MSRYSIIIAEKPKTCRRIAYSLSNSPREKRYRGKVKYYELTINGTKYLVLPALGHLYGLKQRKGGWNYPVFDLDWAPIYEVEKGKGKTRLYLNLIREKSPMASDFILATDYDIEGELLGFNVLRFACNTKNAKRMVFSTLTKSEIRKSFSNLSSLDLRLAEAGETRHILDWYFGVNLTRALSISVRKAVGSRVLISTGRVQGACLSLIAKREFEIREFKPRKFWEIEAKLEKDGRLLSARHKSGRSFSKSELKSKLEEIKDERFAEVKSIEEKEVKIPPPPPFDLGTLQMESFSKLNISPSKTLKIAQDLYEEGYISYPRTDSQKLPPLNYRKILSSLSSVYDVEELLHKEELIPRQGKKEDPAHPAIYPTGHLPTRMGKKWEVYDLIARRFIACFSEPMLLRKSRVIVTIDKEEFILSGTSVKSPGWSKHYPAEVKEEAIPALREGELLEVKEISLREGETRPPPRYTPSTIIREMERRGLGTKATRAHILDILYKRGYIRGRRRIYLTNLGESVFRALEKYSPEVLDEKLTRKFEDSLEKIWAGETSKDEVLREAREKLERILHSIKRAEREIGNEISLGMGTEIGICSRCGGRLIISDLGKKKRITCTGRLSGKCDLDREIVINGEIKLSKKRCKSCKCRLIHTGIGEVCPNPECNGKVYLLD